MGVFYFQPPGWIWNQVRLKQIFILIHANGETCSDHHEVQFQPHYNTQRDTLCCHYPHSKSAIPIPAHQAEPWLVACSHSITSSSSSSLNPHRCSSHWSSVFGKTHTEKNRFESCGSWTQQSIGILSLCCFCWVTVAELGSHTHASNKVGKTASKWYIYGLRQTYVFEVGGSRAACQTRFSVFIEQTLYGIDKWEKSWMKCCSHLNEDFRNNNDHTMPLVEWGIELIPS